MKPGSVYCPEHHARCYRGPGKDARSLEEMIYAVDQSQFRGRVNYSEHTDPLDKEVTRERERLPVQATGRTAKKVARRLQPFTTDAA